MARVVICCAAWLLLSLKAWAMGPADPFSPPSSVHVAVPEAGLDPVASGLAGVRLGARPAALIDGNWVALGDPVRGARLKSLRAQEVVLQHPDGHLERLPLFPAEREPAAAKPATASSDRLVVKRDWP